ncbi:MAG: asparagine synthase (glutamine-hydrolyzing) [Terracoccus sp.]
MGAIAGYHGLGADEGLLVRMTEALAHRGPDGAGHVIDGVAGLAHRRLGGAAAATGDTPITTDGDRFTIVLDGAVHNHLQLRGELEDLGHVFVGDTDAEVALQAFAEWGTAAFDRFNGMFAIAIWDRESERLTLARDHFGIKPLYVCRVPAVGGGDDAAWLFASEIGAILASGHYDRRPNDRTIYRYLRFRVHEDGRETFFDGIERLEPGELMTVSASGMTRRPFTRLREELAELAEATEAKTGPAAAAGDPAPAFLERLTEAVRRRTASTDAVGTSFSGGLDGAAVTAVVDRLGDAARQVTLSAIFPDAADDQQRAVDAVVDGLGERVDSRRVSPTATDFKNDLRDFVRAQGEPLVSSGPYGQFRIMREAADAGVGVVLDVQGADETLAGYVPHLSVYVRQLRSQGVAGATGAASELARSADLLYRLGRHRVSSRLRGRRDVPTDSLLGSAFVSAHAGETYTPESTDLRRRLLEDLFVGSLPAMLRYADRNAAHFSVETRQPFLDPDLVRLVFGLPDEAIIRDGWNKRVLRDAMAGLLPDSVRRTRTKLGYTTPQGEWFMRLKNHIYGVFLSESFADRPYVDQTEVLHAFEGWIKGTSTIDSMVFWRLLNLELWLQEFIDETPSPESAEDAEVEVKTDYEPNARKRLDLTLADGEVARRYPLRTDLFTREDALVERTMAHVDRFFEGLPAAGPDHAEATTGRWYLFISEKIVAITQGRSYFIWDIKVGRPARLLSKYVTRTPAGIGLGSPFTMQLAIEEAGLPRVAYAAVGGAVGKVVGRRGLFYDLVGGDIRAIDGPTEYSVYPANVSAKLAPKDPDDVAARLSAAIRDRVPEPWRSTFAGTVVMDANDIGRNALGMDVPGDKGRFEAMFADNPLGQGSEQTPMALVFEQPAR